MIALQADEQSLCKNTRYKREITTSCGDSTEQSRLLRNPAKVTCHSLKLGKIATFARCQQRYLHK